MNVGWTPWPPMPSWPHATRHPAAGALQLEARRQAGFSQAELDALQHGGR